MRPAFKSFLTVILGLLIFGYLGWQILRIYGISQPVRPPIAHAFLNEPEKLVIAYLDDKIKTERLDEKIALWVEVRQRRDGTLVVAKTPEDAERSTGTLAEILRRFAHHRMILNFRGNREGFVESVAEVVTGAAERILIQSPEEGFLADLRKLKPELVFGTSLAAVTRLVMLSSIGLESLAPLKSDALVIEAHSGDGGERLWNERIINEAGRRKLKIYAGPPRSEGEALRLWNKFSGGILTREPEKLWRLTHPSP